MRNLILIIFLFLLIIGCGTTSKVSNQDLSFIYDRGAAYIHPSFVVYHTSDSSSTLFIKISTSELLYTKPPTKNNYFANLTFSYTLLNSYDSKTFIDSDTILYSDTIQGTKKDFIIKTIDIKAKFPGKYLLKITIKDENRKYDCQSFINIGKENHNERQFFLIKNKDNSILFQNYLAKNQEIKLEYFDKTKTSIYVKRFPHVYYITPLPYSAVNEKPVAVHADSSFSMQLLNGSTETITLQHAGYYHFQSDSSQTKGLTLYRFYNDFPSITTPEQMLSSLRYLATKQELDKINLQKDKKEAIDNFWLDIAGNPDRALELLKKYYTRIKEANEIFSTYMEGWKTDRGMIYVVYGPPNEVYKSSVSETWIYGTSGHLLSVKFDFSHDERTPFTDNNYVLDRSPGFKDNWYQMVLLWRR